MENRVPVILGRLGRIFKRNDDAPLSRIRRRRVIISLLSKNLTTLTVLLFAIGYIWMLVIPFPFMGRRIYIDENALQPNQVKTNWNWGEVHDADRYLAQLELLHDSNATSEQRAKYLVTEFASLGVPAAVQHYHFREHSEGVNAYAVLSSPRTSGAEAMMISASWVSRDGVLNLRGIATVLSLAKFLKKYSLWAKDLIFLVSDGYMDGMQAWLTEYHGVAQANLEADRITLPSGVIWTALCIDYPGHSFSHLGIFHEGLNGRLPNQDLLNSFQKISVSTGGVPVTLYDNLDARETPGKRDTLEFIPSWFPDIIRNNADVRAYEFQAKNVLRHVKYQARGQGSGVHGLFHQFRIDAFTMYGLPATGPHGFHALGRVIESTLRTTNNLLERLHASFFFYIMTGPDRFVKIGNFLPSAVLISVAMMFGGLKAWVDAAWYKETTLSEEKRVVVRWTERKRPLLGALGIMILTHVVGGLTFGLLTKFNYVTSMSLLLPLVSTLPLACLRIPKVDSHTTAPPSAVLKALNLCFASTVISVTTVVNFSLAAWFTILLGIPLSISGSSRILGIRLFKYLIYVLLAFGWTLWKAEVQRSIRDWEVLGVWFGPVVCIIYVPLVLQAGIVCLLP